LSATIITTTTTATTSTFVITIDQSVVFLSSILRFFLA
jgi:hypothetical protein